jgi:D-threo-aldose 1-dehydrogenase
VGQTLRRRRIGRTQLRVSELGLGAASLGNLYRAISDEEARGTLTAATAAGITYVDTAPYYGFGLSERRVGDALRGNRNIVISTKVGRLLRPTDEVMDDSERCGFRSSMPFYPAYDYTYDGVMRSWEASLQRLGLPRVDLLYVHDIGRATHGELHAEKFRELAQGGGLQALSQLRSDGAISAVGIGVNEIDVCLDVLREFDLDVVLLAGRYTLLEQEALDELFPSCAIRGTSVVIGGPYNSGILATGTRGGIPTHFNYEHAPPFVVERVRRIEAVCDRYEVPLAAAALQFPLAHPQVASVIPGVGHAARIAQTLESYRLAIPGEFWRQLKDDELIRSDAPTPSLSVQHAAG